MQNKNETKNKEERINDLKVLTFEEKRTEKKSNNNTK